MKYTRTITPFLQTLVLLVLLSITVAGASALAAFAPPTGTPPTGSVSDVVHTDGNTEEKLGNVWFKSVGAGAGGANQGYQLNSNSAWILLDGLTTVIMQQYCFGTYPNGYSSGTCITSFGGNYSFEHRVRLIPPYTPSTAIYDDYCQTSISYTDQLAGWVSAGSDRCAYKGRDACDPLTQQLKCTDIRMVTPGGVAARSDNLPYENVVSASYCEVDGDTVNPSKSFYLNGNGRCTPPPCDDCTNTLPHGCTPLPQTQCVNGGA